MAGQDAFSPPRLQCWTVPRPPQKLPTPHPPTAFIADDRGHLLPHVPRSQVSPWGTFLGTWDMPRSIPPAWLDLSARSPRAAQTLLERQPRALLRACNGICTRVTGQLQRPWEVTEGSGKVPETPNLGDTPGGGALSPNPPRPLSPGGGLGVIVTSPGDKPPRNGK